MNKADWLREKFSVLEKGAVIVAGMELKGTCFCIIQGSSAN